MAKTMGDTFDIVPIPARALLVEQEIFNYGLRSDQVGLSGEPVLPISGFILHPCPIPTLAPAKPATPATSVDNQALNPLQNPLQTLIRPATWQKMAQSLRGQTVA
jgi:hypothetical protein